MMLRLTFVLTFVVDLKFNTVMGWMERVIMMDSVISFSWYERAMELAELWRIGVALVVACFKTLWYFMVR
jgi:hypothetical protein